jgi:hypothetical protein
LKKMFGENSTSARPQIRGRIFTPVVKIFLRKWLTKRNHPLHGVKAQAVESLTSQLPNGRQSFAVKICCCCMSTLYSLKMQSNFKILENKLHSFTSLQNNCKWIKSNSIVLLIYIFIIGRYRCHYFRWRQHS